MRSPEPDSALSANAPPAGDAIEGDFLAARLASSPLTDEEVLRFAIEIGQALGAIHDAGRIYGCLTPEHVIFTREGARLLPTGRPSGRSAARYRSPEQVRGEVVDWRTDIFSYGALLYEIMAGRPAFGGQGAALDEAIVSATPNPLPAGLPLHAALADVIAGCLQKDRVKRRQRIRNAVIELKLAAGALRSLRQHAAAVRGIPPVAPGSAASVIPPGAPESAPLNSVRATAAPEIPPPHSPPPAAAPERPPSNSAPHRATEPAPPNVAPAAAPRPAPLNLAPAAPEPAPPNSAPATAATEPAPLNSAPQGAAPERARPAAESVVPPLARAQLAPTASSTPSRFRRRFTMGALAVLVLAATAFAAAVYLRQRPSLLPPVVTFTVSAPEHTSDPGTPAVSPNGLHLAFSAAGPEARRMLWLRAFDEMHAQVIPGTEGAFAPFWSPDSEWLGFFANKTLKKVRVRDVTRDTRPVSLCAADAQPGGGTWNRDGVILFAPGMSGGLYRIPAAGGAATPITPPDPGKLERAHLWPQFLPDGRHFVFFNQTALPESTGVYAGSLDEPAHRKLFTSDTNAVYSSRAAADSGKFGYLLFVRDRDLVVQRFNAVRAVVEGAPVILEQGVGALRTLALASVSVSANGVLVYQSVAPAVRQLIWTDRTGKQTGALGEGAAWGPPRISPDGSRVAAGKLGTDGVNADLWVFDAAGNQSQFVYRKGVSHGFPVWSPGGSRLAFWSDPDLTYDIYVQTFASNILYPLYRSEFAKFPTDWSRDGRYLFLTTITPTTKSDVWVAFVGERRAAPILDTARNEGQAALSPDGKWLAYQAEEAGSVDVYVQRFDGVSSATRHAWKISTDSADAAGQPRWRRDGKELFYITSDGSVMAVSVTPHGDEFVSSAPRRLFQTRPVPGTWNLFDVSGDGERFLLNVPLERSNSSVMTVLTNWTEKLKS